MALLATPRREIAMYRSIDRLEIVGVGQAGSEQLRADDDGMAGAPVASERAILDVPVHEQDRLRSIRTIVETLSPASLAALVSLANGRLPDRDPRKVRVTEVKSLRRLAAQAHALDASLIVHAVDRQVRGDQPADISPEAANTASWSDRLIMALEGIVRRYD
jgi:hypothetical protein